MSNDKSDKLIEYFLREEKVYLGATCNFAFKTGHNTNESSWYLRPSPENSTAGQDQVAGTRFIFPVNPPQKMDTTI